MRIKARRGITLVELMIALVIFLLVSGAVVLAIFSAQRSLSTGSGQVVLTVELRKSLDRMARELVESGASHIQRPLANGVWDTVLAFQVPKYRDSDGTVVLNADGTIAEWSNLVTYQLGTENRAFRIVAPSAPDPEVREVLASHITELRFRRDSLRADVVEIQMTASTITEHGQVMSRTMGTQIKVRN